MECRGTGYVVSTVLCPGSLPTLVFGYKCEDEGPSENTHLISLQGDITKSLAMIHGYAL